MIIDFRSGKTLPKKNTAQEIKDIKAAEEIKLKKILDSLSKDSSCKCGVSPLPKSKIVNGKETPKDKYPWMAALMYIGDKSGKLTQYCGGSIISDRYVLTAAHCLFPEDQTFVRLGDHDLEKEGETEHAHTFEVVRQIGHSEYNDATDDRDIGLMKLKESIKFSEYGGKVAPVCLPAAYFKYYGLTATVAGWGAHVSIC